MTGVVYFLPVVSRQKDNRIFQQVVFLQRVKYAGKLAVYKMHRIFIAVDIRGPVGILRKQQIVHLFAGRRENGIFCRIVAPMRGI